MGQRPQHRASTRKERDRPAAGGPATHGLSNGRHRRPTSGGTPLRRAAGAVAVLATVGAIGGGVASGLWWDEPPAAAQEVPRRSGAAGGDAGPPGGSKNSSSPGRSVELSQRAPTLSRSATRAESQTTNRKPSWLASCRTAPQESSTPNGQIPDSSLCELPDGFHLRGDAAEAWARLSAAYNSRFENQPCMTDGYRDLASQRRLYAIKPGLAAQPGTSNHGWGVAVDMCGGVETFGTEEYAWMLQNGARFGWESPPWARSGGSRPEPWHWEYVEGTR